MTLLELVVVIGVIATLSTLLLSSLNSGQDRSYFQTCAANLNQLAQAQERYRATNDFYATQLNDLLEASYGAMALPTCPSARAVSYALDSDGYHYTVLCSGSHHVGYLGAPLTNHPQYSSETQKITPEK